MKDYQHLNGTPPKGHRFTASGGITTLRATDENWLNTAQAAMILCVSVGTMGDLSRVMKDNAVVNRAASMTGKSARGSGRHWFAQDIRLIFLMSRSADIRLQAAIKVFGALRNQIPGFNGEVQ